MVVERKFVVSGWVEPNAVFRLVGSCISVLLVEMFQFTILQLAKSRRFLVVSLSAPDTCVEDNLSKIECSDYRLHNGVFVLLRHYLAEIYGVDLSIDVFGNEDASILSDNELDRETLLHKYRDEGHAVFVNAKWTSYGSVVARMLSLKILSVMIVPIWKQHDWYGNLLKYSSHAWILPRCSGVMCPKSRGTDGMIGNCPWDVIAVFADFSKETSIPLTINVLSTLESCKQLVSRFKPWYRSIEVSPLDMNICLPIGPFNIQFLTKKSEEGVCCDLRNDVLSSMKEGFSSGYRGGAYFRRLL